MLNNRISPVLVFLFVYFFPVIVFSQKPLKVGVVLSEKSGSDLASAAIFGQYRILKKHYVTLGGNAAYLKRGFDGKQMEIFSGSVGYGWDTPLGPIELTYGHSNEGDSFYFNLGYWF